MWCFTELLCKVFLLFFFHPLEYCISKTVLKSYSDLISFDTYSIITYMNSVWHLCLDSWMCTLFLSISLSTQWSTLTHCISNQIHSVVSCCFNSLLMDKSFRYLEKYLKCHCKNATAWFILCVGNNPCGISSLSLANSFQCSFFGL